MGLISPAKKEDSAYRLYDAEAITRLKQIIILRKLRIPLKQIAEILQSADARVAIEAFERNLAEIEDEINALATIRSAIKTFIEHLCAIKSAGLGNELFAIPDAAGLPEILDSLTVSKINFKEEKTMEELNQASEKLSRLEDKDVRIIYIPPMTVAEAYASGEDWVLLKNWVEESGKYESDWNAPRWVSEETIAGQGFEETLNFYNNVRMGEMKDLQLDLLFPVKLTH